ncbi:MAG: DUF6449 domain-containing protein [Lachnospiraceae bacterium]|nr:DUF6449 domain-containing protein [Lachnospiraceae bacterium]
MTSRHLYFKLLWEDIKRKAWAAALFALTIFFAMPVVMAMILPREKQTEYVTMTMVLERRTKAAQELLSFGSSYPVLILILMVTAVVLGISSFSYLHNRKQVDFYHSLPVQRKLQFAVHMTTGLVIPAVIYLLGIAISILAAMVNGVRPGALLGTAAVSFLCHMLSYALIYVVVVLAMMMTGTRLAAVLGTAVFFGYFPALGGVITVFCGNWLKSYYYDSDMLWNRAFPKLSPISAVAAAVEDGMTVERAVCMLAVVLALGALNGFLYQKRPSEAAGKTMAFWWSRQPIKALLVMAFGLYGAFFFSSLQDSLGWTVFGAVMGTAISHCVIEIIYNSDFKKLFCHEKTMAVCMAAVLAVVLGFRYDVMKFDEYIPKESKVAYASVNFGWDDWVTHLADRRGFYSGSKKEILRNARIQNVPAVIQIAEECVRQIKLEDEEREAYRKDGVNTRITIAYTLNSGRKVFREYYVNLKPVLEQVGAVFGEEEYRKALYPGMRLEADEAAENLCYQENARDIQILQGTKEQKKKLYEVYREEFMSLPFETRLTEIPVGEILLISEEDEKQLEMNWGSNLERDSYYYDGYFYPVYPSFQKTLAALEACGIKPGDSLAAHNISQIEVTCWTKEWADSPIPAENTAEPGGGMAETEFFYTQDTGSTLILRNPEQIAEVMKGFAPDEAFQKNELAARNDWYRVTVYLKGGGQIYGRFLENQIPELVEERFREVVE